VDAAQDVARRRDMLQETMNFTAALAFGVEQVVGRGANGMAYLAGRKLGIEFSAGARKTADLGEALAEVRSVLRANRCLWDFELFEPAGEARALLSPAGDGTDVLLVFRDCMIRQSLFRFGHQQKGSLCRMMYGFFAGALETITGRKSELEILHAGENACLKRLRLKAAKGGS
jgi:predicted hydrocarbon binding protein